MSLQDTNIRGQSMNKTSEALRKEIAEIYRERSVMDLTKADEIINKVLNAFEASYLEYDPYFEGDSKEAFYNAMTDVRPNK